MEQESDLVERAQAGDEEAFMELVGSHKPKITQMASRFGRDVSEVGDLTQEIFLEVWKSLPEYQARAPFDHWISRVALNRCRKFLRKEYPRRLAEVLQDNPAESDGTLDSGKDQRSDREAKEVLDRAMSRLKPDDALILSLRELEGYSLEEIAEIKGWSIASVKVRGHRARKRLREILETNGDWP